MKHSYRNTTNTDNSSTNAFSSFSETGRLINVKYQKLDFGWEIMINFEKRFASSQNKFGPNPEELPPHEQYVVDVLLNCAFVTQAVPSPRITTDPM